MSVQVTPDSIFEGTAQACAGDDRALSLTFMNLYAIQVGLDAKCLPAILVSRRHRELAGKIREMLDYYKLQLSRRIHEIQETPDRKPHPAAKLPVAQEHWSLGKNGGVVSDTPNRHNDVDYYGGYLIGESIPSRGHAALIAIAPQLLRLALHFYHRMNEPDRERAINSLHDSIGLLLDNLVEAVRSEGESTEKQADDGKQSCLKCGSKNTKETGGGVCTHWSRTEYECSDCNNEFFVEKPRCEGPKAY